MVDSRWDKEADVAVVGYGLAGVIAAVEAHDAGARVVILEKSQHPGGCSILSAGMIVCAADVEAATEYLTQTSGGRVDGDLIHAFAQEMAENEQYLRKLALVNNARVMTVGKPGTKDDVPPGGYPFAGEDNLYRVRAAEVPGFTGFPWVRTLNPAGANLLKVAFDNVDVRHIEVLQSTPAKRLVTDTDCAVPGIAKCLAGKSPSYNIYFAHVIVKMNILYIICNYIPTWSIPF